jgi:hypothetical protein
MLYRALLVVALATNFSLTVAHGDHNMRRTSMRMLQGWDQVRIVSSPDESRIACRVRIEAQQREHR